MHDRTAERVEDFLHAVDALVGRLDRPAQDTLEWLLDVLDYRSYLREQSAVDEIGEARVRTAEALVGMAEGCASTPALLEQIVDLASRHADAEADSAVEIRSIHRAKGAEWPVVVVPGCNDGTLPQRRTRSEPAGGEAGDTPAGGASDAGASDIEEERRLLDVAVTRAVDRLVLTYDADDALSPFLADVDAAEVLEAARRVQDRLGADPAGLDDAALAGLCRAAARLDEAGLDLKRYLRRWWPADDARRQALRRRLDNARPSVADARQAVSAYRQARKAHREERRAERRREGRATQGEIERLREVVGQAPIPVQNEAPDTFFPDDARFAFAWTDDETAVAVRWNGERVGMLDPLGSPRLRPDTFFDLPWPALVGRFEGVSGGRSRLRVAIDWAASADRAGASAPEDDAVEDAPDPPPAVVRDLASPAFASGWNVLREALGDDINRLSTESAIAVQTS
jgi:DNA helicase-2/ATP-dependent DNA helicase PcrA